MISRDLGRVMFGAAIISLWASCTHTTERPNSLVDYEIVELTHTLDEDFPFIPVPGITFPFSKAPIATIDAMGVAANSWRIHEHIGTQIDAPNHFIKGGEGLEALEAQDLIIPAAVIDFRAEGRADADAVLTRQNIIDWEAKYGAIPGGAIVVLNTGWSRKIGSPEFVGLDDSGKKHFPGFSPDSLNYLVEKRDIWGVAVDTLSFDPGEDDTYASHRYLLGAGGWALEALANVDQLPPIGATLVIGAPRVAGATGGPARVIGLVPKESELQLDGKWVSEALEPLGVGGFLNRAFEFEGSEWKLVYTLFEDAEGNTALLSGEVGGTFNVSAARGLTGAFPTDFSFDFRKLSALSEGMAAQLNGANCGTGDWTVGVYRDLTAEGCAAVRLPSLEDCPIEYDLVDVRGEKLYLGARTTGPLCNPYTRAETATAPALVRAR